MTRTTKKTTLPDPVPAKQPKMDLEALKGWFEELGLSFAADQIADLINRAVKTDFGITGLLDEL